MALVKGGRETSGSLYAGLNGAWRAAHTKSTCPAVTDGAECVAMRCWRELHQAVYLSSPNPKVCVNIFPIETTKAVLIPCVESLGTPGATQGNSR